MPQATKVTTTEPTDEPTSETQVSSSERRAQNEAQAADRLRLQGRNIDAISKFDAVIEELSGEGSGSVAKPTSPLLYWCWAHRGAAKAAVGDLGCLTLLQGKGSSGRHCTAHGKPEMQGALCDFERSTTNPDGKARDYSWAWAHQGEALRTYARDRLFQSPGDGSVPFHKCVSDAWRCLTVASEADPGYTWAHAHRAATGVLAVWHEKYLNSGGCAGEATLDAVLRENYEFGLEDIEKSFETARLQDRSYGWAMAFDAIYRILRIDPCLDVSDCTALERKYDDVVRQYKEAVQLLGEAQIAGASQHASMRALTVLAGYQFAWAKAAQGAREELSDSREPDGLCSKLEKDREYLRQSVLTLAENLLASDPEDDFAHITLCAVLDGESGTAEKAAFENSVSYLRMVRARLDKFLKQIAPDAPEVHEDNAGDLEFPVLQELLIVQGRKANNG